jgi:hypothetical protein
LSVEEASSAQKIAAQDFAQSRRARCYSVVWTWNFIPAGIAGLAERVGTPRSQERAAF